MKAKKLIILGSILIFIIGIILISDKVKSAHISREIDDAFLPGFSVGTCSAFSIKNDSGSVKLRKENKQWFVFSYSNSKSDKIDSAQPKEYRTDSVSVKSALETLSSIKLNDLISQNPEKREIFEVDSVKGTRIEVWDAQNKSIGVFFIGKSGPGQDWNSNYVRTQGSDKVYIVRGGIKFHFFTEENRWRDKTILKYDPELTLKISIARKNSNDIILEKSTDTASTVTWNITEPKKAKAQIDSVSKIVNNLSDLIANDFENNLSLDDKKMGFGDPTLKIFIELENGDTKLLTIGNKNQNNKYWVRNDESEYIFLVNESKIDNYNRSLPELIEKKGKS